MLPVPVGGLGDGASQARRYTCNDGRPLRCRTPCSGKSNTTGRPGPFPRSHQDRIVCLSRYRGRSWESVKFCTSKSIISLNVNR